uniref:NADH dehydrogenase subunit 6 n=1 Tax=Conopomorpha sinensis TaxID=940481 RepID=UPI001F1459D1|nr:NADH dehydrogenase subunit 6 [Conopomorpha sinensis]UIF93867.1 NADH dehydrogenase subunit 6 [Conopomorpha sinensis]
MKIFIMYLITLISLLMYFLNHPLSMGLMILIQTLLLCLISGMMINTYWFSYILFLTFMGGLLVLFIYVSSITSNELFFKSYYMILYFFIMIMSSIIMYMYMKSNLKWMNFSFNYEMNEKYYMFYFFNNENKINLTKLYNNQTFMLMMILIIYLFITLVAVVKITNIFYGPLRSNFN